MSFATLRKALFFAVCLLCLSPLMSLPQAALAWVAPAALLAGLAFALTIGHPYQKQTKGLTKTLLQASVVLLGFSMDIGKVAEAGRSGLLLSLASISLVFGLGWVLTRLLKISPITGLLVSAGTAICGGSAIAAVSSVVDAPEEDVSVAVGTVFLLNALALLIFPPLGHLLGLSQRQFGQWSGIAIHDIASVVGAGTAYGKEALEVGTAVKLSRVLYLVPVTFLISFARQMRSRETKGKIQVPWFVGLFILASLGRTAIPWIGLHTDDIKRVASSGFALCLFLIGTAITRQALKRVGTRPLILGAILWLAISLASLAVAIRG